MPRQKCAVHRTILVVDVEGFGNSARADPDRLLVRDGLYRALRRAFRVCGIPWARCDVEDRGDGILVLAPAQLPKSPFAVSLPRELAQALRQHNARHDDRGRIRLRAALNAGEVSYDEHGVTAGSVNLAFRLLDSPQLRAALAASPGVLALAASMWFFDEVIRNTVAASPASYRPVRVTVKETSTIAWIARPDCPYPPEERGLEIYSGHSDIVVPRQLPAYTPHFVGRSGELAELTDLLGRAADRNGLEGTAGTVVISAIGGTAGIGKTKLGANTSDRY